MAKITKDNISVKDPFGNITKSAKEADATIKSLELTLKMIKEIAKGLKKDIKVVEPKDNKTIKDQNELFERANKLAEAKLNIDKRLIKEKIRIQEATKLQNKAIRDEIKETSQLNNAYKVLTSRTNKAQAEFKRLAATFGINSKQADLARRKFNKLDTKLRAINNTARDGRRDVGRYGLAFGKAGNALKGFAGALGITAGIAGLSRVIGGAIKTNKDFQKSLSSLSSITGATGKDLEFYKEQAKEIGATTTLSATQAVDAFKLIGSQKPELLKNAEGLADVTKQAVILAEAAGIELPDAAKALTTSLNQMDEAASESGRFINILAAGSKEGAADIPYLNAAIEKSGAVARDANLSFEQLVAGIETIAPSVSEPSSAGLKFADILLRLQKSGKGFESGQFDLKDALSQVKKEFEDIKDPVKLAQKESLLFGKNSIVVGKALVNNIDKFENFTTAITDTNTALEQQKINTDNLDGDMKSFSSTIEAVSLSISGSGGFLRAIVQVSTEVLKLIFGLSKAGKELTDTEKSVKKTASTIFFLLKVISLLTIAFVTYKGVMLAGSIATKLYTAVTTALRIAKIALAGGIGKATKAMKLFNLTSKANPLGIIIALLALAVTAYYALGDSISEATRQKNLFNKENKTAKENEEAAIVVLNEKISLKLEEIEQSKRAALANAKSSKEEDKINAKSLKDRKELFEFEKGRIDKRLLDAEREKNGLILNEDKFQDKIKSIRDAAELEENKSFDVDRRTGIKRITPTEEAENRIIKLTDNRIKRKAELNAVIEKETIFQGKLVNELTEIQITSDEKVKESGKGVIRSIADRTKELGLLKRRLEDLNNQATENDLERQKKIIKTKFRREIEALESIENKTQVHYDLITALTESRDAELIELNEKFLDKKNKQLDDDELRFTTDETEKKILEILQKFDEETKKVDESQLLNKEEQAAKLIKLTEETQNKINEITSKKKKSDDPLADDSLTVDEEGLDKALEAEKEAAKERAEVIEKGLELTENLLTEHYDRRLSLIEREKEAHEKNLEAFKQAARDGNIVASESLAEEQRLADEAQVEEQRIEKEKQQMLMVTALLKAFNSELASGKSTGEALASAIVNTTVLQQFAKALPAFLEGTENTGSQGQGVDGKGGFHAVLHPNERVMTKEHNEQIGDYSNDYVANIMEQHRLNKVIGETPVFVTNNNTVDGLRELKEEMKLVKDAIIDKPVSTIEIGKISQTVAEIRETTRLGNRSTVNRFVVK